MQIAIRSLDNAEVGTLDLDDAIFGIAPRTDIVARVVNWQLAKRRAGTHKVKERGEINRTKAKMFRQKGTGRARHGAQSANIFRGGGIVHGPRVRDHGHKLPKKVRELGLKSALSAKVGSGDLIVVDGLSLASHKTAELVKRLEAMGVSRALVIDTDEEGSVAFRRAAQNIIGIDVLPPEGANVYDIVRRQTLVLTTDAAKRLEARLS